ncbi:MAG: hypothetical protein IJX79_03160 [Clostridia bacterium]|nr:hypothetical protein [Clostridia bacterium]
MTDTRAHGKLWFVICVLSCCILGACLLGALILNIFTAFSLWWIYLCFIPLSVISLIFSAYKLTEGKLALIILSVVSVILILVLCLVSGFIKLADDHIDTVNSKIDFVNAVTGISLPPAPFDAYSDEQKIFDDENRQFVTVQSYGYYLPDKKLNGLLDDVVKNKNWISYEEDGELFKHFSPYVSYYDSVCLFYNVTEKTYNTLPAGDTPCEYIIVTLDPSYGSVNIYIFTI